MIRFFRNIRQKLAAENKVMAYLRYAIGEILLVVIGILIALSINNWKTNIENQKIEHEYYCQLLDDLELDKIQLETLKQQADNSIQNGERLIKDLHSFKKEKDELMADYIKTARSNAFVPTSVAYNDLMSSGKMGLLKNKHLKKNLIGYYTNLENTINTLRKNQAFRIDQMLTAYDDLLEFGWQSPSVSGLNLDEETLKLLPNNQWHKDKNNVYFKNFQEVVFICMSIADREIQLYNIINEKMKPLYQELKEACQNN